MASIQEMLSTLEKYHQNYHPEESGVNYDDIKQNFMKYISSGQPYYVSGRNVFLYKALRTTIVEFHVVIGSSTKGLIDSTIDFCKEMKKKKFLAAITYYDNPMISYLGGHSPFPIKIDEVNLGIGKKYQMTIDLRG